VVKTFLRIKEKTMKYFIKSITLFAGIFVNLNGGK